MFLRGPQLKSIANNRGSTYFVSTCYTFDNGIETMVFTSEYQPDTDSESDINYDLIDFSGLHQKKHSDWHFAKAYHENMVEGIRLLEGKEE